jgi:hypothetical protein
MALGLCHPGCSTLRRLRETKETRIRPLTHRARGLAAMGLGLPMCMVS